MRRLHRLAEARHDELCAAFRTERKQCLRGLVPRMHRQAERAPMHRQEHASTKQRQRFERVFGAEVDVAPRRMECAYLEHHQIERTEPLADGRVFSSETGIT